MTPDEKRWAHRLRRVLQDMPETVEIQVHQSRVQINAIGAREETFRRVGHADEVECLYEFQTKRFYPCSESI